MAPLAKALVALMFTIISRETPAIRQHPDGERAQAYRADIAQMVAIDEQVAAAGKLVNPEVDRVLLGAIRYYEARFRSQPKDGDCHWKHPRVSTAQRIKYQDEHGMAPAWLMKPKWVCAATGPMQISKGNRYIAPAWPEVRQLFSGIKQWDVLVRQGADPWSVGKADRLSVAELKQPATNVRFGYALLWHWKVEADQGLPESEPRTTPPGVWLTAWGWGKLPPLNPKTVRYVDMEGKRRCQLMTRMMRDLAAAAAKPGSGFSFQVPAGWYCGHEPSAKPHP